MVNISTSEKKYVYLSNKSLLGPNISLLNTKVLKPRTFSLQCMYLGTKIRTTLLFDVCTKASHDEIVTSTSFNNRKELLQHLPTTVQLQGEPQILRDVVVFAYSAFFRKKKFKEAALSSQLPDHVNWHELPASQRQQSRGLWDPSYHCEYGLSAYVMTSKCSLPTSFLLKMKLLNPNGVKSYAPPLPSFTSQFDLLIREGIKNVPGGRPIFNLDSRQEIFMIRENFHACEVLTCRHAAIHQTGSLDMPIQVA